VQAARGDVRPSELADDARRRARLRYWMIWRFWISHVPLRFTSVSS
jgi:hypothetical protein